jgi:hypothetical protein
MLTDIVFAINKSILQEKDGKDERKRGEIEEGSTGRRDGRNEEYGR